MPPIRTQTITPTGFSLQTQAFGLLEISISQAGNTTTVTCRKNGVQEQAPTVTNATPAVVETLCNNFMNGQVLGVGSLKPFYNAVHIFSLAPLSLKARTSNTPITGEWWLDG